MLTTKWPLPPTPSGDGGGGGGFGAPATPGSPYHSSYDGFERLARVATECVEVCEKIRELADNPVASPYKDDLRDLSLTLAALDRVLFAFVDKILQESGRPPLASGASLEGMVQDLRALPADFQSKRLPPGGIVSILYHLATGLEDLKICLVSLEESRYQRLIRFIYPLAVLGLILYFHKGRLPLQTRQWPSTVAIGSLSVVFWQFFKSRSYFSQRLRRCHRMLGILLRIWLFCMDIVQQANMGKNKSYALLQSTATDADYGEGSGNTARRLIETIDLPQDAACWFGAGKGLSTVKYLLNVMYAGLHVGYRVRQSKFRLFEWPASIAGLTAYALRPAAAAEKSFRLLKNINLDYIAYVWRLPDTKPAHVLAKLLLPRLTTNEEMEIEGLRCQVLADFHFPPWFFKSDAEVRKAAKVGWKVMKEGVKRSSSGRLIPIHEGEEKLDLPVLGMDESEGEKEEEESPQAEYSKFSLQIPSDAPLAILFVHGGGFVGSSYASDMRHMARWAQESNAAVFYAHYSLAPESTYPKPVDECLRVFHFLRRRCRKVVICGESAGGNIATSVVLRLIEANASKPDGLVLAYPPLNMNRAPSPSRALHLNDPLIPGELLKILAAAYVPDAGLKPLSNFYISPCLAPDEFLRAFPPTSIVVGGLDPLLDDAIDFNTRLRRQGVPGTLKVHRGLPHGFLILSIPHAREGVATVFSYCLEFLRAPSMPG